MKLNENYIVRKIAGETMLVCTGGDHQKYNGLFTLSGAGEMMFSLFKDGKSPEEAALAVTEEYDVDRENARTDAEEFFHRLVEMGILTDGGD